MGYVTPKVIADSANNQTDETFTVEQLVFFFNQAISDMNLTLEVQMPTILSVSDNLNDFTYERLYTVLPERYMRSTVQYYMSYAIKAQDSSSIEAQMFWDRYLRSVEAMKGKMDRILTGDNAQYLTPDLIGGESFVMDLTGNVFGNSNSELNLPYNPLGD